MTSSLEYLSPQALCPLHTPPILQSETDCNETQDTLLNMVFHNPLLTDADYKSICDIDQKQRAKIRQYRVSENYIVCVCSENDNFPDLPQQVDLE